MGLIIATPVLSDAGTITASSASGIMTVGNLLKIQPTDVWRPLEMSTPYITIDLGSPQAIDTIGLLYTNASSAATWRIRAATSEANLTASPGYDSGVVGHWLGTGLDDWDRTHALKKLSAAETYQWWRIDISDAANAAGHYQAGRLYLANAWEPTAGIKVRDGWNLRWIDASTFAKTVEGNVYPDLKSRYRKLSFGLSYLSETEMWSNAADIDRLRGSSRDMLVSIDPDHATHAQQWTVCGLMREMRPIVGQQLGLFSRRYELEEMI